MATKESKADSYQTCSLTEMKDQYTGIAGTADRDKYAYEPCMGVLGKMIKSARQQRHFTQEELGKLVGVQKAQIFKLETRLTVQQLKLF